MVLERTVPSLMPVAVWLSRGIALFGVWLLAASLAEAEGFVSTRKVLLVIVAALGLVLLTIDLLIGDGT